MSPGLTRRDTKGLANEACLSNPIVSSKQQFRCLKTRNCIQRNVGFKLMKSIWKILSVKTRITCRSVFRTQSSNYHGAFLVKKLMAFSRQKQLPKVFYKKSCCKIFRKIYRKIPALQSFFLNKSASLRPGTLFKKETLEQVFSCEFCETLRTPFERRRALLGDCL